MNLLYMLFRFKISQYKTIFKKIRFTELKTELTTSYELNLFEP